MSQPQKCKSGSNVFPNCLSQAEIQAYFDFFLSGRKRQRTGDGYLTICPFHFDTHPSLKVSIGKGVFYCHGCGAKGGLLDFGVLMGAKHKRAALVQMAEIIGRADLL